MHILEACMTDARTCVIYAKVLRQLGRKEINLPYRIFNPIWCEIQTWPHEEIHQKFLSSIWRDGHPGSGNVDNAIVTTPLWSEGADIEICNASNT